MKIRKKEPSVGILGKIVNSFTNSKQDTYSADYLNKMQDNIESEINNISKDGVINQNQKISDGTYYNMKLDTVAKNSIYSTDEIEVGRWIDGKKIYRKVHSEESNRPSGIINLGLIPENLKDLVDIRVYAYQSDHDNTIFIGSTSPIQSEDRVSIYVNGTQLVIRSSWDIKKIIVILEYTKTTE